MTNYYLYSILLKDCPYSNAAKKLLESYPNINKHIETINRQDKEKYKTPQISTFPQIYLKRKDKNGSLLIGGYTDLEKMFNLFHKKEYSNNKVNEFINNNNKWSRKGLLRFISLINTE